MIKLKIITGTIIALVFKIGLLPKKFATEIAIKKNRKTYIWGALGKYITFIILINFRIIVHIIRAKKII